MRKIILVFLIGCAGVQDADHIAQSADAGREIPSYSVGNGNPPHPRESPMGVGPRRIDAGSIMQCACWLYPMENPPYICIVEICINCVSDWEGVCFYSGRDPI